VALVRLVADQFADLAVGEGDHVRVGAGPLHKAEQLGGGVGDALDDDHASGRVVGPVPADRDVPARAPLHEGRLLVQMFDQAGNLLICGARDAHARDETAYDVGIADDDGAGRYEPGSPEVLRAAVCC
jgi:hypothetical protein